MLAVVSVLLPPPLGSAAGGGGGADASRTRKQLVAAVWHGVPHIRSDEQGRVDLEDLEAALRAPQLERENRRARLPPRAMQLPVTRQARVVT